MSPNKDEELKKITLELQRKTKESEDYLNTLKRTQADFENFIKRTEKERKDIMAQASEQLILKLLPLLDQFDCAIGAMKKQGVGEAVVQGVELLHKNFRKVLQDEGVRPIESIGKKADPFLHEIVLSEERDGVEDGIVLEELQKGYTLKGKVIRCSKIKVAKAKGGT